MLKLFGVTVSMFKSTELDFIEETVKATTDIVIKNKHKLSYKVQIQQIQQ